MATVNKVWSVTITEPDIRETLDRYCRERGLKRPELLRKLISRLCQEIRDEDARWAAETAQEGKDTEEASQAVSGHLRAE